MARWQITIAGKGIQKRSIDTLVSKLQDKFDDASINVTDASPPESRADRLAAALAKVDDAKSEIESLRDELQEWYDNLPENFQSGEKGDDLQTTIDALESAANDCDNVVGTEVSFPGMF